MEKSKKEIFDTPIEEWAEEDFAIMEELAMSLKTNWLENDDLKVLS